MSDPVLLKLLHRGLTWVSYYPGYDGFLRRLLLNNDLLVDGVQWGLTVAQYSSLIAFFTHDT